MKLILDHPFFAVLALHLIEKEMDMGHPIIQQLVMPTCGVDGHNLYVNPEWVKKLNDDERIGLLAHEVMHVALGHIWPWRRQWREKKKWNSAGDYVINAILRKEGFTLPKNGLHDPQYDNMSAEAVYDKLAEDEKKNGKSPEPTWEDLLEGMVGEGGGQGDKEGKDGKSGSSKMSKDEMKKMEQEWKERLIEAVHIAKMKGKVPAGMERLVDDVVSPKVPWYALLDQYVNEIMRDDYNELIHDRRYVQYGIYLPDMYSEGCDVCIGVDTSGSIGPEEIKLFVSESIGILRSRNVRSVRIMACDAEIHLDVTLNAWDPIPNEFPGGGGTDFRPVFNRLSEEGKRPAVLIYLTDTFGDFPEEKPNYPVIWAGMTDDPKLPWGIYIKFDPHESGCEIEQVA